MYSMPPDHGAAVVAHLLDDERLRQAWVEEVAIMVARMQALRALLASRLAERLPGRDFGWLSRQRGMFSLLGLDATQLLALREQHHIYVPPDGRINVAGISGLNVDYVADAIAALTQSGQPSRQIA